MEHSHPTSAPAVRPFLRWAGAKRAHVALLSEFIPHYAGSYFEPFMGSASLFFHLLPRKAYLSDSAVSLVRAFQGVRQLPNEVHAAILKWPVNQEVYYNVRSMHELEDPERTARFIYLNKTCWNGLYRVNRMGQFNVPFGRPKSQNIVSLDTLLACSKELNNRAELEVLDFEAAVERCMPDDFVFFDPPYVTRDRNGRFTDYNERLFSWDDQKRLALCARRLARGGVSVLVTNADDDAIRDLYPKADVITLERQSTLASTSAHRRRVSELVIRVTG